MEFSALYARIMSMYDSAMKAGLKIPFVKIDREKFLKRKFWRKTTPIEYQKVLSDGPLAVFSLAEMKKITKREVRLHAIWVGALSFLLAIPSSGVLMWVAIALDFVQFQLFVFVALQKLLYLFGCKTILRENENFDKSADWVLLLISTVMIAKSQVIRAAKSAMGMAVKQGIQRFTVRMISKLMLLNVMKQVAKWMGVIVTRDMIAQSAEYVIPFLCALVSGVISLWLFFPMMRRLRCYLMEVVKKGDAIDDVMNLEKSMNEINQQNE